MNMNNIGAEKDKEIIAAVEAIVEKEFKGQECKIWLSGIPRVDAEKAATKLRSENLGWSFSVEDHGSSSYLVMTHSRLAESGHYGDH